MNAFLKRVVGIAFRRPKPRSVIDRYKVPEQEPERYSIHEVRSAKGKKLYTRYTSLGFHADCPRSPNVSMEEETKGILVEMIGDLLHFAKERSGLTPPDMIYDAANTWRIELRDHNVGRPHPEVEIGWPAKKDLKSEGQPVDRTLEDGEAEGQ